MKSKQLLWIFVFIFLAFNSFAYNISLDDTEITAGQAFTLSIETTAGGETNDPYTVYWYKSDGTLLETDTGTMAGNVNGVVFETYQSSSNDVTTNGNVSYDLNNNGIDDALLFNILSPGANISIIDINDAKFSAEAKVGQVFAVDLDVKVNNKSVDGVHCSIYGTDTSDAPLQTCTTGGLYSESFDGRVTCNGQLEKEVFMENQDYLAKIRCHCKPEQQGCFDEDGNAIGNARGSTSYEFTITPWLASVTTLTDKSSYTLDDEYINVCVELTNNGTRRLPVDIFYSYRCGGGNNATDRVLIDTHREFRGISANTTQNQCARLHIKNVPEIQNKVNSCYASTDVGVILADPENVVISYSTTSSSFTITSTSSFYNEERSDTMGTLAISFFVILISGLIFYFSLYYDKRYVKLDWVELIIRRSLLSLGIYMLMFVSGIHLTIAEFVGINLTSEMFFFVWLFGLAGYVSLVYVLVKTLFEVPKLWKQQAQRARLGDDD